jgi:hypothetical protein
MRRSCTTLHNAIGDAQQFARHSINLVETSEFRLTLAFERVNFAQLPDAEDKLPAKIF